jgi:hypothetical protein
LLSQDDENNEKMIFSFVSRGFSAIEKLLRTFTNFFTQNISAALVIPSHTDEK